MPEGNPRAYVGVKWRGVTLNSFNGKKWFNDNADRISFRPKPISVSSFPRPMDGNIARTIRCITGFCARRFPPMCFLPPPNRGNYPACGCSTWIETGSLHNPQNLSVPFAYDVVSDAGLPPARELQSSSPAVSG